MEGMTLEQEWYSTLIKGTTRAHHKNGWKAFKEFMNMETDDILELRKKEERFETRVIQFYQWLQQTKKLSQNTSVSTIIAIRAFFSFAGRPLRLKGKLPKIGMRKETHRFNLEDLQKMSKFGDIAVKLWISLSRDIPMRIGDMIKITREQIEEGEFLTTTQKENVPCKCFVSEETRELWRTHKDVQLPNTDRGINKLLERACQDANIPVITQHQLRKLFFTTSINIGNQELITNILTNKSVPTSQLTYYLDRDELKDFWKKVVDALPLEPKNGNGRITNIEEMVNLAGDALKVLLDPIIRKLVLEKYTRGDNTAKGQLGVIQMPTLEAMSTKEVLELFLKLKREE